MSVNYVNILSHKVLHISSSLIMRSKSFESCEKKRAKFPSLFIFIFRVRISPVYDILQETEKQISGKLMLNSVVMSGREHFLN